MGKKQQRQAAENVMVRDFTIKVSLRVMQQATRSKVMKREVRNGCKSVGGAWKFVFILENVSSAALCD